MAASATICLSLLTFVCNELGYPHHISWWLFIHQFFFHEVHIGSYVAEELAVALAQIVEAVLTVSCHAETVLWAAAIAGKLPFTFTALVGQTVTFGGTEFPLALAVHHGSDAIAVDIAQ